MAVNEQFRIGGSMGLIKYFDTQILKSAVCAACFLIAGGGSSCLAEVSAFPDRTVEIVTHGGPGGGTDVTARMMMLRARQELKAAMVIVNRRGGGTSASMDYLLSQPADGHTILTFTSGQAATLAFGETRASLSDMRPVARGTDDPQILMTRCRELEDPEQLIEMQKKRSLTYGVTALQGVDDLTATLFARLIDAKKPQFIVFSGGANLSKALASGLVDVAVLNLGEAGPEITSGKVCPQIVMAKQRMHALPDVASSHELGIPLSLSTARGFVVHRDTPDEIVERLEAAFLAAMSHPLYQGYLKAIGLDPSSVVGADAWGQQMIEMVKMMEESRP